MCRSIDLVELDVFGRCVCGLPFLVLEPNQPSHLLSLRVTLAIHFRTLGKGMTSVAMVSWIWKRCATRHQTFSRGWFGWYRFGCKERKTQMKSDQGVRSPSIAVPIRATAFCVLLFGGHCELRWDQSFMCTCLLYPSCRLCFMWCVWCCRKCDVEDVPLQPGSGLSPCLILFIIHAQHIMTELTVRSIDYQRR